MSTELVVALIVSAGLIASAIVSAIVSVIVSRHTAKTHSWASAASDGRLRAHQEAYEICWDLYCLLNSYDNGISLREDGHVKEAGDFIHEIRESRKAAREWWKTHCVYLDKRIKNRFWNCLHLAKKYEIGIFDNKRRLDQEMKDIHDHMRKMLFVIGTSPFRSNYPQSLSRFWPLGRRMIYGVPEDVLRIQPKR